MLHKFERSDSSHAILDKESRDKKALKIITSIEAEGVILSKSKVLDIGTGAGYITEIISKKVKQTHSVDVVDERKIRTGYKFLKIKDEILPYEDGTFDVVISNHVIEHVLNQKLHLDEMYRVLKPQGIVYLATPNKLWIKDPHYKLVFVNWMSRQTASSYVRLTRKAEWDIRPLSRRGINVLNKKFVSKDIVPQVIKNPKDYSLDTGSSISRVLKFLPTTLIQILSRFSPTIILILRRR